MRKSSSALAAAAALLLLAGAASAGTPAPSVAIVSPAAGDATNARTIDVAVRFRAHGNVKTIVLKLDGREVGRYANPPSRKEGSDTFTVDLSPDDGEVSLQAFAYQANERAGHVGASAVVPLVVDRSPPQLVARATPGANAAGWHRNDVTVAFLASDRGSGIARVSPPVSVTAEGVHAVTGRATDRAGNSASASLVVRLDKTPPALAIGSPEDGATVREEELTIEGSASDARSGLAGVACNGAPASLAASRFSCRLSLVEAANAIAVHAVDAAGNERLSTLAVEFIPGVRLEGSAVSPALAAVTDFTSERGVQPGEIATDADGRRLALTLVEIAFQPTATVGQVNALLASIDGSIESMLEGVAIIVVRIPDPGSVEEFERVIARVEADPLVRYVNKADLLEHEAVPANVTAAPVEEGAPAMIHAGHHLAVRAHAAWNARAALFAPGSRAPLAVVADVFGDGQPNADLDMATDPADFAACCSNGHGYHVAGIIAGSFGGAAEDRGLVTGMFPARLELKAIDLVGLVPRAVAENRIVAAVRAAPGKVVVNTSIGSDCDVPVLGSIRCSEIAAESEALNWIEKVRGSASIHEAGAGLENKFVHAAAAGNDGVRNAHVNSSWNAARLLPGLDTLFGGPVPNLTNVLVVENRQYLLFGETGLQPGCLLESSSTAGDVSAIGTFVWSFTDARSSANFASGTSMASPQAAGLAAYVWALDPSLAPSAVVDIVKGTARPPECAAGAPLIDAYAALLAVDDPDALASSGRADLAPARGALLDIATADGTEALDPQGAPVAGNQRFDEEDVRLYLARFDAASGVQLDFSRADLNGDGRTGGSSTAPFDLEIDNPPAHELVTRDIAGVPVAFDENEASDLQILCYYAHSPLYTGSEAARDELLGREKCIRLDLQVSFPGQLAPGENAELTVRAVRPDVIDPATGEFARQPDIRLELVASGGTIVDPTGLTDADGVFRTSAALDAGQSRLTIEVIARAGENGPVLARATVLAAGPATGTITRTISFSIPAVPSGGFEPFTGSIGSDEATVTLEAIVDASGAIAVTSASGEQHLAYSNFQIAPGLRVFVGSSSFSGSVTSASFAATDAESGFVFVTVTGQWTHNTLSRTDSFAADNQLELPARIVRGGGRPVGLDFEHSSDDGNGRVITTQGFVTLSP